MKNKRLNPIILVLSIIILGSLVVFLVINYFYMPHTTTEKDLEGEASVATIEQGNTEKKDYPILEKLPIKTATYTIGYQLEDDGTPTILVDTAEWYFEDVLKILESLGTEDRPASSYHIKIVSPELGEEETIVLQKFFAHQL